MTKPLSSLAEKKTSPSPKIPGWVPVTVTIGLVLTTLICIWIAGTRELTNTESVLLGVILSAASMLVSWLATHVYSAISVDDTVSQATQTYSDNVRTLGVRAAEKVLNLSTQLQRLGESLSGALDDADEADTTKAAVLLLRERVQSAIYNLETLKSMNDTFLSDWRGVIGDEIGKQEALERQIEILHQELRNQFREKETLRSSVTSTEALTALEQRITETEERLAEKIADLPFKVATRPSRTTKADVALTCPSCSKTVKVRTRTKKGSRKLVRCTACDEFFRVLAIDDGDFAIAAVPLLQFAELCPLCSKPVTGSIPDHPGSMLPVTCDNCGVDLVASRSSSGTNLRVPKAAQRKLPKSLYDAVFTRLPARPWPTYIHKAIAKELGVSNSAVSQVIGSIVAGGHFPLPVHKDATGSTQASAEPSGEPEPSVTPDSTL